MAGGGPNPSLHWSDFHLPWDAAAGGLAISPRHFSYIFCNHPARLESWTPPMDDFQRKAAVWFWDY